MKLLFFLVIFFTSILMNAQKVLTLEGKIYTDSSKDTWLGVNIPRSEPTVFTFKNNSITSLNNVGYMLQAGDEREASGNNNLDRSVITGNKFVWNGTDMKSITHGLFTGHNIDVVIKYNYLDKVPMGIIRKSTNNMVNTGGGVAYNIVKDGAVGIVVKGMSNVNIYNNTLYTSRTTSETWRPLVHIYTNTDRELHSAAHGTKIFNNIFYTKYQTFAISIDDLESLTGLQCDYNVYWCETGSPRFLVDGVIKTFEQWQAMGYDEHSVILNPEFIDLINFVPKVRLDKGKDLGTEWKTGLSRIAKWSNVDPATADQNGTWQVGAVIYESSGPTPPPLAVIPEYVSSVINSANPSVIVATYNSELANIVPPVSSFIVNVNSVPRSVNSLTVTGKNVNITLASPVVTGDAVSLAYNAPSTDGIMTPSGGKAASMTAKTVQNNVLIAANPVYTGSVIENSTPSRLEIFFNLNLTNIVPAISAFTATVNGTSIKINSVSVSGNKVNLALSRPLLYGDEVFISYSKPDINPLQTPSGSTVESILSEFVANNILETDGFNEDGQNKIVVYPNPAIDYITVSNLQPSENLRIVKIFNYAGKVLLEHQLDTHASKRIPVNLESGMYFLQIFAGQIVEHAQTIIVVDR